MSCSTKLVKYDDFSDMEVKTFKKGTSFSDCHRGAMWTSPAFESSHESGNLLNVVLTSSSFTLTFRG